VIASILGSHFAGAIVMAINYQRMGQRANAWRAVLIGLVTLVGLLAAAMLLPDSLARVMRPAAVGIVVAMLYVAKHLQGSQYERFLAAGGKKASGWAAAGIGLACLAVILGSLLAYVLIDSSLTLGTAVEVPTGGEIYCGQGSTREECLKVAAVLSREGLDLTECTVQLSRENGRPVLAVVVLEGAWEDFEVIASVRALAQLASEQALNKEPVDVVLWDEECEVRRRLEWEPPPGQPTQR
jgi:hypothetical protein